MRAFLIDGEEKRLLGTADIPADHGPVYEAVLFGAASIMADSFTIGTITHLMDCSNAPVVERVVLVAPGQVPGVLPRWQPHRRHAERLVGSVYGSLSSPHSRLALLSTSQKQAGLKCAAH